MTIENIRTFPELVRHTASSHADRTFLPRRHARGGEPVTHSALLDDVRTVAAGLLAAGLKHGDRVALIAENRYEWLLCDLACAWCGLVDVPRGTDTAPDELRFILRHSGCRFALVETEAAARALLAQHDALPDLERSCLMTGSSTLDGVLDLDALRAEGAALLARDPDAVDAVAAQVTPDDLLTIVYTSGTTANPKGVMLTHGNVLSNMRMVDAVLRFDSSDVFLSVLPAWHAYERIMDYLALYSGGQLVYSDRRGFKDDLRSVAPTIFAAVPRIWEMIHDGMVTSSRKQKQPTRAILEFALENCRRMGAGRAGLGRRTAHAVLRRTVLPRYLAATGGRLRLAVSGGGSLPGHVDECLLGMGLPLLNGYGLTETSPVASVRLPETNRPGTIGPPLPSTEFEIRDEHRRALDRGQVGVIWIRGPQVMQGYFDNTEATAAALADGWFDSGDLGFIGTDGQIRITGRAKDTIVLAGGENVEPERIETTLKTSPFIEQAMVVGQDQKTLSALIVPDNDCLTNEIPAERWGRAGDVLDSEDVRALFRREIDRLIARSEGFRPVEKVAAFRVLTEPFTTENGLLTQTLKIKRHKVHERHATLIAALLGT